MCLGISIGFPPNEQKYLPSSALIAISSYLFPGFILTGRQKRFIPSSYVIPVPHQVRDKLQRESIDLNCFWTPAGVSPRQGGGGSDSMVVIFSCFLI
jgi:hypothetical protein